MLTDPVLPLTLIARVGPAAGPERYSMMDANPGGAGASAGASPVAGAGPVAPPRTHARPCIHCAIPYFLRTNRRGGQMRVWIPVAPGRPGN